MRFISFSTEPMRHRASSVFDVIPDQVQQMGTPSGLVRHRGAHEVVLRTRDDGAKTLLCVRESAVRFHPLDQAASEQVGVQLEYAGLETDRAPVARIALLVDQLHGAHLAPSRATSIQRKRRVAPVTARANSF
jgi:hypothetical protein